VWKRWLASYPELPLLELDVGYGQEPDRRLRRPDILARVLLPHDERVLLNCLQLLVDAEYVRAAVLAINEYKSGTLLPDNDLLAGAFFLAQGQLAEACTALDRCYRADPPPGDRIRHLCPSLRLLLRISPCQLLPLYPNAYGTALMYAVALWRSGQGAEALEVLREMSMNWGLYDEIKLVAGQIHLERGRVDRAQRALVVGEDTKRDALELARNFYLAYAHYLSGEYRTATRVLKPALILVKHVNPHLHARARLLMSACYEQAGSMLEALRESARVAADEVPYFVAAEMLKREQRLVTTLGLASPAEVERLALQDSYYMYQPDAPPAQKQLYSALDISRDPLDQLQVTEMSWRKRQIEEQQIAALKAAAARGEDVHSPWVQVATAKGQDIQARIKRAEQWWPSRRQALETAPSREQFAREDASKVGHLRFDFCGSWAAPATQLQGERYARLLSMAAGAVLLLGIGLWFIRCAVY